MSVFKKILVTTDFSDQALPGVEAAAALASGLGSRIELLYVVEDQLPPILGFTGKDERQEILENHAYRAGDRLATYAEQHLSGCEVETTAVIGNPASEIVRCALERQADLIVIASRGFGPMRQLLLGSTAERVLHHSSCPVLVVPSRDKPPLDARTENHSQVWMTPGL